jgi:F-type H+-transporting ATPase subunit b
MMRFLERKGKPAWAFSCVLVCMLLVGGFALGSEGGEQGAAHEDGRGLDLLYRFINFALLVIILFVVIRKTAIKDFFSARREEIKRKLEELNREKQRTEEHCRTLEGKLKEFEAKKKEIIEQFKTEGLAEKERIIAEARERSDQILRQADLTIQREMEAVRDRLRNEVVEMAARRAQEMITSEIGDSDQDELINDFIKKVEKLH